MADARRLLVVHQGSELYGSDRMLIQFLHVASRSGHQMSLHVPYNGPLIDHTRSYVTRLIVAPISILRLYALKSLAWLNVNQFCKNLLFAWQQLKQHDTVLINSCVILSYMVLLPFYKGKKYVYVHEIQTGFMKFCFNLLLWATGAHLICNSLATAKNYNFVSRHKKQIVYNSVISPTSPQNKPSIAVVHLLMIGRISERKGHKVLLNALQRLPQNRRARIHLRIVGDSFRGQTRFINELMAYVTLHKLQDQITFYPFTSDPTPHYQWAHCVVVPSIKPESFGLVALEAMHHSCAVIASHIGALPEIVSDRQTGLIVKPQDSQDLAHAIQFYCSDPTLMAQHGQAGYIKSQQDFSFTNYQDQIERLLHA